MSESINYYCPHPVFVNKVVLKHKKALSFTYLSMVAFPLQEQGCIVEVRLILSKTKNIYDAVINKKHLLISAMEPEDNNFKLPITLYTSSGQLVFH